MKHSETESPKVVTHIFVSDKTDLARQFFVPQCMHSRALYNSGIFVQRNAMTALSKPPACQNSNELEVLNRLDKIQPRYRQTRIHSLTNSIGKARLKGKFLKKDIKRLLYENLRTSNLKTSVEHSFISCADELGVERKLPLQRPKA